jgi:hypothetical protein
MNDLLYTKLNKILDNLRQFVHLLVN